MKFENFVSQTSIRKPTFHGRDFIRGGIDTGKVLASAVILLLFPVLLFSAELFLSLDKSAATPRLIIIFQNDGKNLYLQTLEEGYTSEVTYTIRMRKKNSSFTFLNQQGRNTIIIKKEAVKEYLTGMYIITSEGTEQAYQNPEVFSKAFFSCVTELPPEYCSSEDYSIDVMAVADLIKRPKPLSLLEPFLVSEKTETGWVRLGN